MKLNLRTLLWPRRRRRPRGLVLLLLITVLLVNWWLNSVSTTDQVQLPAEINGSEAARLVRVVDGDTLVVQLGSDSASVRVIGINTPETKDTRRDVECLGQEATAFAQDFFVNSNEIYLKPDSSQQNRDRYGRLLRYVGKFDPNSNQIIDYGLSVIAAGFAQEYTYEVPYAQQAEYRAAQAQAQAEERGLWEPGKCE